MDQPVDAGPEVAADADPDTDPTRCGNGTREAGEECDDGDDDNSDGCVEGCRLATCGDGFTYAGEEECDDGDDDNSNACIDGCKLATCGDGFLHAGEEECDDGDDDSEDACVSGCRIARCGDGFVRKGVEECDDSDPGCTQCMDCGDSSTSLWADNGHCYKYSNARRRATAALSRCLNDGGYLATLTSAAETEQLVTALGEYDDNWTSVWIGARRQSDAATPASGWYWMTGEDFVFGQPPWSSGEPNNLDEDCAELMQDGRDDTHNVLNDLRCNNKNVKRSSVCERQPAVVSPSTQHAYKVVFGRKNWQQASDACAEVDGHLATISSATEDAFIVTVRNSGQGVWIGARREGWDQPFTWVSGEPWDYTNWGDQPTADGDCAMIGTDGQWHRRSCTDVIFAAMCEIEP